MSAYKVHTRDPLLWQDGFNLTWRNNEDGSCPTGWAAVAPAVKGGGGGGGDDAVAAGGVASGGQARAYPGLGAAGGTYSGLLGGMRGGIGGGDRLGNGVANVTSLVWGYVWAADWEALTFNGVPAAQAGMRLK